jgi:nucleotide-binding universal stress UspA family protein
VPCGDWHLDGGCVVVGVDGSEGSDIALRWAADLSEPLHAEVYGVFTVDEIYETFTTPPLDLIERKARFTAAVEEARRGVQFVERTAGDIVSGLADESAARHAALLVVGARARGSLGGLLLGTVPDKLIHEPPCPVAVLPFDFLESQLERAR